MHFLQILIRQKDVQIFHNIRIYCTNRTVPNVPSSHPDVKQTLQSWGINAVICQRKEYNFKTKQRAYLSHSVILIQFIFDTECIFDFNMMLRTISNYTLKRVNQLVSIV